MLIRFCLYSVFKNLRFFEPFFFIYLLAGPAVGGPELSYFEIGLVVGYQKLLTGLLEIPLGVITDRVGRRSVLVVCFACYAVAFPMYATASQWTGDSLTLAALYAAQTVFGLAEALRTGSHKAIMLDWADQTGRGTQATHILGLTRFFSKSSAGAGALVGGALLYGTGRFEWLFWAATLPAAAGVVLMVSYPKWLEGEISRSPGSAPPAGAQSAPARPTAAAPSGWIEGFRRLWAAPAIVGLMLQSVLFESQVKVAQHYLQPFLKTGLEQKEVAVIGSVGALFIGVYYLVQDLLGGVSAFTSSRLERWLGGGRSALVRIHTTAAFLALVIGLSLSLGWLASGVAGFIGLALLQNARRPIFLTQFNAVMDKPQRATTLSIESQARSFTYSALAPATGWLADTYGLEWVLASVVALLVVGLFATRFFLDHPPHP